MAIQSKQHKQSYAKPKKHKYQYINRVLYNFRQIFDWQNFHLISILKVSILQLISKSEVDFLWKKTDPT
jgi:hypothetical protein